MSNAPDDSALIWHIKCTHCDWQANIQALAPYTHHHTPAAADQPICGFWEDYICAEHLEVQRNTIHLSDTGIDLESAHLRYFTESSRAQERPRCPTCRAVMQGGQALEQLPFLLQPLVDIQTWTWDKIERLQQLYQSEKHAILHLKHDTKTAHQLLRGECELSQRFHKALCKEFDINPISAPFISDIPRQFEGWEATIQYSQETLSKRMAQTAQRQEAEHQKSPAQCPDCHHHSVYLVEASTI